MALNIKVKVKEDKNEGTVKKEIFLPPEKNYEKGEIKKEIFSPVKLSDETETHPLTDGRDVFSAYNFQKENKAGEEQRDIFSYKADSRRKNIIFYFTDQQRYDTFNGEIMPNLTALAEDGITFDNCFTCQPVCGPARACLQTGVYATETGCYKNGISLPENTVTLASCFSDAGYETAYIGKWHLASDKDNHFEKTAIPKERLGGYDYFRGADVLEFTSHGYDGYVFDEKGERIDFKGYRADCINDFAVEYIDNYKSDKPFFMFVSQLEPHHQNDRRHFEGYTPTVPCFRNYPLPEDLTFLKGNYKKEYPDYLSAINRIDFNLSVLINKLKEKGIYDDTIIVFTSDHGCHFRTRNAEYKRSCHDSSIHVPLVIRGGAFRGGLIDERLVSLIDLPATILSAADIEVPAHFSGNDLKGKSRRQAVYIQISESQCARAIRTREYTYCVTVPSYLSGMTMESSPVYMEEYLYDIVGDPLQTTNLIKHPDYKIVRSAMKKILLEEMEKAREKKALIIPAVTAKKK